MASEPDTAALEARHKYLDDLLLCLNNMYGAPIRDRLLGLGLTPAVVETLMIDPAYRRQVVRITQDSLNELYRYRTDMLPEELRLGFNKKEFMEGMITGVPDAKCQALLDAPGGIDFLWQTLGLNRLPYYERTQEKFLQQYKTHFYTRQCLAVRGIPWQDQSWCAYEAGRYGEETEIIDRDYSRWLRSVLEGAVVGDHLDLVEAYAGRHEVQSSAGFCFANAKSLAVAQALYHRGMRTQNIEIFDRLGYPETTDANLDIIRFYLDVFDLTTFSPEAHRTVRNIKRVMHRVLGNRPGGALRHIITLAISSRNIDNVRAVLEHPAVSRWAPGGMVADILYNYVDDHPLSREFIAQIKELV